MNIQTIDKRIIIEPALLNDDVKKLIKQKIMKEQCTERYGYIIDIIDIISYSTLLSRNDGSNIVNTKVKVNTFTPFIGLCCKSVVNMIFPQCIFAEYMNIKIVIPASELLNFEYNNQVYKKDEFVIKIGDILEIEITNVRYKNKNFSCIGKLKI